MPKNLRGTIGLANLLSALIETKIYQEKKGLQATSEEKDDFENPIATRIKNRVR